MIAQADSRKWMACLYNSFLFMEAKIMKMAKKLLAVVLTGVMALSMLTGCALTGKVKENALLDQLNAYAASTGAYTFKKADKVTKDSKSVDLKTAASKAAKAVRDLEDTEDPTTKTLTFEGSDKVVTKVVAVPTSGDNKWSKPAKDVYDTIAKVTTYTASTTDPKVVNVYMTTEEVKAKLAGDTAAKTHTFIIVVAPLATALA